MTKPRVGIFSLTCCEGCQIEILNLEDQLLDIVSLLDIKSFRLGQSNNVLEKMDVAFLEGSVSTEEDLERTKEIRKHADVLIALGTCACTGGVQAVKNFGKKKDIEKSQFGDKQPVDIVAIAPSALSEHVDIDMEIKGCPIDNREFVEVLKHLLQGIKPYQREWPVCVECKKNENPCLLDSGYICMGPITYSGCDSVCPSNSLYCIGCRGVMHDSNVESFTKNLIERGHKKSEIKQALQTIYGKNERLK